jgi:plasmid stabilization system protein ParE
MRVRFVSEAGEDLAEATAYLNERSAQVAQRFLAEVERAIQLLLQFPRLGSPLDHDPRCILAQGAPYRTDLSRRGQRSFAFVLSPTLEDGRDLAKTRSKMTAFEAGNP